MKITKYPDGASIVSDTKLEKQVFKINTYEDLWHLNQFVDAFWSAHDMMPHIIIPNLLDAQADRRFRKGESSNLKLVCNFLNDLDAFFYIFHPHNPEVVEALMDNVEIIDNSRYIVDVLSNIRKEYPVIMDDKTFTTKKGFHLDTRLPENLILMSSDAGGFKPMMKLCDELNWQGETYSASKARTESGMKQLIDREDFGGKDILIVDDLSVGGGTFKGLATLLKDRNLGKLYLAVSHITVKNMGTDPITNYFNEVYCTNSKYDTYISEKSSLKNLNVVKLF